MIDNFNKIESLLEFKNPMDFVQLYIFKRKKDQIDKDNHQSVRTVKSYSKENIVKLTAKEHYIVHFLLTFIYPYNEKLTTVEQDHNEHGQHPILLYSLESLDKIENFIHKLNKLIENDNTKHPFNYNSSYLVN